jgi:glycosyltransferase involved in cell wall biosynthesis
MRIGLISNDFTAGRRPSLGGIGTSNHDLASGLTTAGHEVTVVGVYGDLEKDSESCEPGNGPRVVRLKASPVWFRYRAGAWFDRWRVRRWLAREHPRRPFDIIEVSDYAGWLPWGGPKGVPVTCRLHGSSLFFDRELARAGDEFEHNLERRTLKMADFWIGPSRYVFSKTLSLCSLEQHNGSVISNAVDAEVFSPSRTDETEPGLIVFVNSLNPKKGIEQLLDAMNLVCQSHPEAHLAVIGQDAHTKPGGRNYLNALLERVRPEFRGRVTFLGWLDREVGVLHHLRRASVCCYPSHMESFGIAPIEAMAVGRPTIFSKTGPGPEVIEDGVSGLLCNPLDSGDIAQKIRLILDDAELAARLGAEGRRRVLALFNKRDWIRRNVEFYESCVASMHATRKPDAIRRNS